jgi:protein TonB
MPELPPPPAHGLVSIPSAASPRDAGAGTREAPRFVNNRPPAYPETARHRRWQGTVYLRIRLDAVGTVVGVEVARSSGYPVLDAEAVNAVRQWRAEPARRDGQPVASEELLPVRFELP